jgi:hypothetical protein
LDIFISPNPRFEGDIPISAIPILTQSPSSESINDQIAGASAGASKTQTGKWKVAANLTPQKKPKKAIGKSSSGIKINEPIPKASPAPTPPLGSGQKKSQSTDKRGIPVVSIFHS